MFHSNVLFGLAARPKWLSAFRSFSQLTHLTYCSCHSHPRFELTQSAYRTMSAVAGLGPGRPFMATVLSNKRITSQDHFQDTRHIELDLAESGIMYEPGDLLAVMPRQDPEAVACFLQRAGLNAQAWVQVSVASAAASPLQPAHHTEQVGQP